MILIHLGESKGDTPRRAHENVFAGFDAKLYTKGIDTSTQHEWFKDIRIYFAALAETYEGLHHSRRKRAQISQF